MTMFFLGLLFAVFIGAIVRGAARTNVGAGIGMKPRVIAFIALAVLLGASVSGQSRTSFSGKTGLTIRSEPDRVVLQWSGSVASPMREKFAEAFAQFEDDPRQLVISLHSPGGSVQHGHEVIKEIRKLSRLRQVDTLVEGTNMCASMCVPIYLVGAERWASPTARFMFHEARLVLDADSERALREYQRGAPHANSRDLIKAAEIEATDDLFGDDMGPRSIDARWLQNMRQKIKGHDVWLTGRQLTDQGSGVVDRLKQDVVK